MKTRLSCHWWWKVLMCRHLSFQWKMMTVLMVLFVSIQILGVFWQFRMDLDDREHLLLTPSMVIQEVGSPEKEVERKGWIKGGQNLVEHTAGFRWKVRAKTEKSKSQNLDSATERGSTNSPASLSISQSHPPRIHNNRGDSNLGEVIAYAKDGRCQPKTHIFFLKTHKTASSSILNILYRYGDIRNLTFALPLNMRSQLFYPHYFESKFVEGVRSRSKTEFHIMCNHMRFNLSEVREVMTKDTFYFSILRNPVGMMESLFMYYKSIQAFHRQYSLEDFLNNGWRSLNVSAPDNHYARNVLAFDFGFDNNIPADDPDLEKKANMVIAAIERDFQLILISEYFDESMILLKRALCWSLDDVISFKLNSRSQQSRWTLSPLTAEKIKSWNALDWLLYLHFNTTFWKKVDTTVGREEMKREVARLQERRAKLTKTCLKDSGAVDPSQVKDARLKPLQYGVAIIQGYNLNPGLDGAEKKLCEDLITPELQYTISLFTKQFPELAAKHTSR